MIEKCSINKLLETFRKQGTLFLLTFRGRVAIEKFDASVAEQFVLDQA